ncbi:1-acyl-sn-glycerol-3-phosphate acyltransferase [Tateyamaria armeniaca]|uniref:1-acyl-sn-glycerol-3-phosphate acyltransferase n=1 Tax=Tateyamaria armeniaca TaxID=2518930 RepID=A0ABW8UQM2_9RHOB
MIRFLDATLGRWLRHFLFVLVRSYYALFYNVSCAGKHLLQDRPGTLILATHVSRHDGPLIAAILYATKRIRPTVHYDEYYNWSQFIPMFIASAIPMSSPKSWPDERRKARKAVVLEIVHKVLAKGNSVLLFPAGKVRREERERVPAYLSGVHDILRAEPNTPVMLLRIDGLGAHQPATYDSFWTFLGIKKGRRHVTMDLRPLTDLDASIDVEAFNARLEDLLNTPISHAL